MARPLGVAARWKDAPSFLKPHYGAHGAAGRIGSWDDGLVILSPGDVLRVRPEGGYKTKAYALVCHPGKIPAFLRFVRQIPRVAAALARARRGMSVSSRDACQLPRATEL